MSILWHQLNESGDTAAMKVPTGIVIRTQIFQENGNGIAVAEALCFVPTAPDVSVEYLHAWIDRVNGES